MSERTSTVARLAEAGFVIGPPADGPCQHCPDRWGDHVLYAPLTPLDGGTYTCPVDGCGCHGTWDVPQAEAARRRLEDRMSWIWVSLHYATFGLKVEDGKVVDAAPIARWAVGKPEAYVAGYFRRKGATFERLPEVAQ